MRSRSSERLATAEATVAAGERLGRELPAGAKVALVGPLGAGKTTFVKGIAKGLGIAAEVTSPTFTIVHEHEGARGPVHHVDLYRIDDPSELLEVGFWEMWEGPDVVLVEWADRLPAAARRGATHEVRLTLDGDGRRLAVRTTSGR